jgi:hypothetical protein
MQIPAAPETNETRLIPDLHATSINFEANQLKIRFKIVKNYISLSQPFGTVEKKENKMAVTNMALGLRPELQLITSRQRTGNYTGMPGRGQTDRRGQRRLPKVFYSNRKQQQQQPNYNRPFFLLPKK